jgi:hypothetical protein
MTDLITNYLACWNETDAEARRALINQHWSRSATYVDPLVEVVGHDDLSAAISAVQNQFPSIAFPDDRPGLPPRSFAHARCACSFRQACVPT